MCLFLLRSTYISSFHLAMYNTDIFFLRVFPHGCSDSFKFEHIESHFVSVQELRKHKPFKGCIEVDLQ